jgi:ubiquinone/menaquinone biosynthesis C-methylase UbiE
VEPLLPDLTGMQALDIACGTGRWLADLRRRGARTAIGIDLSREMLAQARCKPGLKGRLVEGDLQVLPFGRASVDFAVCSFALSYVEEADCFTAELARVVKLKGHVIVTDLHPSAQARGWKRSFRHGGEIVEIRSFTRSVERIRELFARQGFEIVSWEEPSFGEEERAIFEQCGRGRLFREVRGQSALYVGVWRKA